MEFETWLKKQKKRNDKVGDLARDYIESIKWCQLKEKCNKEHLNSWDACRNAYSALAQAKNEYRKTRWKLN